MELIEDLDDSWCSEYEQINKEYNSFYKENLTFIKLTCVYIDKTNLIAKIKEEKIILEKENLLSKENIIAIIKRNNTENNIKYSPLSILKYNIDLDPLYLKTFLKNDKMNQSYLTSIKTIDHIHFTPTIQMFHDLNNLFILFYQNINKQNITKKVHMKTHTRNKTLRKEFKD